MNKPSAEEKRLNKKYFWIVISFVIAVGLWLYVVINTNPMTNRTFVDVPIDTINEDALESRGLAIPGGINEAVNIQVRGNWFSVVRLKQSDLTVVVDLEDCEEGENTLKINADVKRGTSEVIATNPSEITVEVDSVIEQTKDIEVSFSKGLTDNRKAVCVSREQDTVQISGAKSLVKLVDHVQAEVSSSALTDEPSDFTVELKAVTEDGIEVDGVRLSEKSMTLTAQLYYLKAVPVEIETFGDLPEGLELAGIKNDQLVTIAAPKDELEKIEIISAEAIDLSQIHKSQTVKLKLILPGNVILAGDEEELTAEIKVTNK